MYKIMLVHLGLTDVIFTSIWVKKVNSFTFVWFIKETATAAYSNLCPGEQEWQTWKEEHIFDGLGHSPGTVFVIAWKYQTENQDRFKQAIKIAHTHQMTVIDLVGLEYILQ